MKKIKLTKEIIEQNPEWLKQGFKEGDEAEVPEVAPNTDRAEFANRVKSAQQELIPILNKYNLELQAQTLIQGGQVIQNVIFVPKKSKIIVP